MKRHWIWNVAASAIAVLVSLSGQALAQKKYGPGVTDTEIKLGNIMPYSGPVSAFSIVGRTEAAYFDKVNAEGGINGRMIKFISYDDAFSPPKAVEQARKLVESDEVLLLFNSMGTPSNAAIQKYMNIKKVPQLFASTGASRFGDHTNFPWTMGWLPHFAGEGRIYGKHILSTKPDAKVGILYQNDDYGRDMLNGLKQALGPKAASMIVGEESYETGAPTIDAQVVVLQSKGADVFVSITTPKYAAQSIKKVAELNWKPLFILNYPGASVGSVLKPAGFENSQGIVSATWSKDATDPQWKDDPGIKNFDAFLAKYYPTANREDYFVMQGYNAALAMVHVLKACGDDLTRENVMKVATSMKGVEIDGFLPGITVNTGPQDYVPIKQMRLMRFKDDRWELFGDNISGAEGE
jgi:ABC-type branched-subunit amino acid transport system substrate-binding protein